MDGRGTLHGRHHATLQSEVLIVESSPDLEARMPIPDVFDSSSDDPKARLLPHDLSISSTVDLQARFSGDGLQDPESNMQGAAMECSSSPVHEPLRQWDETYRLRKRFGGLPTLDTLDIMRESSRILRRHSDLLTTLAAALIVPISVVILTHVLITRPVIKWVEKSLVAFVSEESVATALHSRYTNFVYLKLAEFIVTSVLCIPLAITLAALAKAGIVYTVASTYTGLKVSFVGVMQRVVPRVWFPLIITYASSCLVFLASGVAALLCLGFSNGLFEALRASSTVMSVVMTVLGLIFFGIFTYLKIILNVANVICVVEDIYGFAALARGFTILQGRVQVAFCSYLVTFFCGGFLTLLFQLRVTDQNDYTEYNSSGSWEGPLLVLMHSFVYLFDDIMTTVFYFTCPTSSSLEDFGRSSAPEEVSSIVLTSL